jgi:SHS family lactate transporter-like MFS transporter
MPLLSHFRRLTPAQRNTFFACFLGWSLDAFDFFTLVLCVNAISAQFHAKVSEVSEAIFWTLAMRPLGAFLFGLMADRFGRRPTLMLNIITFSGFELASAFAPSLKMFLITRALFGIAMGGEWGVGAALAFETLPIEGRGFFSGLLQEGYVIGQLLAGLAYGVLFPTFGWRGMFVIGAPPALLVIYMLARLEESPAWLQRRVAHNVESRLGKDILTYLGSFLFLTVLMFALNLLSHGTQDLYPTFLERNLHFTPHSISFVVTTYSIGALLGGIFFGTLSERIGRRRAIVVAAILTLPLIPFWAYPHSVAVLALVGFLMQFMVQGAWGVIPAHLNELSPPAVRGTFPGFTYQVGNLLASRNSPVQAKLAERRYQGSFSPVFAWTVVLVATLAAVVTASGPERRGADFSNTD